MNEKEMNKLLDEMRKADEKEKEKEKEKRLKDQKKEEKKLASSVPGRKKPFNLNLNSQLLDKELSIKVKPAGILKIVSVFVVLLFVFYMGRFSVDTSPVAVPAVVEESSDTGFFSAITGLFSSSSTEELGASEPTAEPASTEPAAEPASTESAAEPASTEPAAEPASTEPAAEPASTEPAAEPLEEEIITTYSKVALAVNDVFFDWKTTWGKITKFKYTIKNEESGTIEPDYFMIVVEGYTDYDKKIPLPVELKTVKAHTKVATTVTIPSGFSYNELETGSLDNVDISFLLYDINDKLITSYRKGFNLAGN